MVYPNFEAGEINQEGTWAGTVESDTLDSNLIRIGQQFKKREMILGTTATAEQSVIILSFRLKFLLQLTTV